MFNLCLYFVFSPLFKANWIIFDLLSVVVQSLSHVWLFVKPWTAALQHTRLSYPSLISQSLLKLMLTDSVMPFNHLILHRPLLLLPSIFPRIRVFFNELALHIRWLKYWSFNLTWVLPVNVQGWFHLGLTGLKSFLSKEPSRVFSNTAVQKHQFFSAQPSLWSNSYIRTRLLEKPELFS